MLRYVFNSDECKRTGCGNIGLLLICQFMITNRLQKIGEVYVNQPDLLSMKLARQVHISQSCTAILLPCFIIARCCVTEFLADLCKDRRIAFCSCKPTYRRTVVIRMRKQKMSREANLESALLSTAARPQRQRRSAQLKRTDESENVSAPEASRKRGRPSASSDIPTILLG